MAFDHFDKVKSIIEANMPGDASSGFPAPVADSAPASNVSSNDPAPVAAAPVADPAKPAEPVAAPAEDEGDDEFQFSDETETPAGDKAPEKGPNVPAGTVAAQSNSTELDEDSIDWSKALPKEVESTFLRTPRGKQMLQAFKERRELSKSVDEGGLGFIPSGKQIKEWSEVAQQRESMDFDFQSGDPRGTQGWAEYWFAPTDNPHETKGQTLAAQTLPRFLMQSGNAPAFQALTREVQSILVQELISRAEETSDETERKFYANFAKAVHEYVGLADPIDVSKFTGEPSPSQSENPEVKRLRADLAAREQRDQQDQTRRQEARQQVLNRNVATARGQVVDKYVGEALDLARKQLGDESVLFQSMAERFRTEVLKTVQKGPGWAGYVNLLRRYNQTGAKDDLQAANDHLTTILKPAVRNARPRYMSEIKTKLIRENQSAHQTAQTASQASGIPSGGASPAKPLSEPLKRQPGEDSESFYRRLAQSAVPV